MVKSRLCLGISSLIYGTIPVLIKLVYIYGGTNGIETMVWGIFLIVPLLFFVFIEDKKRLILSFSELKQMIVLGVIGITTPVLLLCFSYNYVNISAASALHYAYPLVMVIASAFIYNENIKKSEIISSIVVTFGIFMLWDISAESNPIGIILAFLSGIFHSFYIMYMKYSDIKDMDFEKLSFCLSVISCGIMLAMIYIIKNTAFVFFDLPLTYSVFISSMAVIVALPLLHAGIKHESAAAAGVISMTAPLSAFILDTVFLHEQMNLFKILGIILIITGIVLLRCKPRYKTIFPQKSY